MSVSRRSFLQTAAQAGFAGSLGGLDTLLGLGSAFAQEAIVTPDMVRYTDGIEPIVRLIERTPRDRCVEVLAREVQKGLTYREFLAALFLAGIRNVSPQPPGFKFHCVFIIHSANYLSQMSPPNERLLPVLWALDDFKRSQLEDEGMGDFVLPSAPSEIPKAEHAWEAFHQSMEAWDEVGAGRAISALVRSESPERLFEALWLYGARDYRNLGHKAIFVSHAWRTLQTIGWQHAEPTLRSLVLGLLDFGPKTEINDYRFEDQSYGFALEAADEWADRLPLGWEKGDGDAGVAIEVLEILRKGNVQEACGFAAAQLASGKCSAQSIWDGAHLAAGEMMMRQPGIIGVHTVTSLNSLRFAFRTASESRTRFILLLQGLGWMAQFRNFLKAKRDRDVSITDLEATSPGRTPKAATAEILDAISRRRSEASALAYGYGKRFEDASAYFDGARRLIFLKMNEHHQLKWPAAIFEDYHLVSPRWRPHMLATSVHYLRGTSHKDSTVTLRAIEALKPA